MGLGEVYGGHADWQRWPQRLLPPGLQLAPSRLLERVGESVRARRLGPGQWKVPVQVRVLEPGRQVTGMALAARFLARELPAEQELPQPQCQPLLADAWRAVEQDGMRQLSGHGGGRQPGTLRRVALHRLQAVHRFSRSQLSGSTASMLPPATGTRTWNSMCAPSAVCSPPTVPTIWPAATF